MDTNATRALVAEFNEAWANNDAAKMIALSSDDLVWSPPLEFRPRGKDTIEGRETIISGMTGGPGSMTETILKPGTIERTVRKLIVEGDTAVAFHYVTAEQVSGEPYINEYVWFYTCADGKVTRLEDHFDTLAAYKQSADHPFFIKLFNRRAIP